MTTRAQLQTRLEAAIGRTNEAHDAVRRAKNELALAQRAEMAADAALIRFDLTEALKTARP